VTLIRIRRVVSAEGTVDGVDFSVSNSFAVTLTP